jgi:hypothetical protein
MLQQRGPLSLENLEKLEAELLIKPESGGILNAIVGFFSFGCCSATSQPQTQT